MAETDRNLSNRILIGLAVGTLLGLATLLAGRWEPAALTFMKDFATSVLDPFGQVFLRMLFFVVIPLVFTSPSSDGSTGWARSPGARSRSSSSTWPSRSGSA
jgi:DAACS family dicarboxylate/amino acid:cation (Na+ or H+) symporter